jgi:hypothetical protein
MLKRNASSVPILQLALRQEAADAPSTSPNFIPSQLAIMSPVPPCFRPLRRR